MQDHQPLPRTAAAHQWEGWVARDQATLLFVIRQGSILLIRKKRGLGAGKINGPGGRLDAGETPLAAAIREVQEEVQVTPLQVRRMGDLAFQFVDGYSIFCTVFRAEDCDGTPTETAEADPLWADLEQIPYDEMWADDRLWLPELIAGREFSGRFIFDGDHMVDCHVEIAE